MKILVMCHGNVNRSPLCATVLRQLLDPKEHEVRSAGFVDGHGRATIKMIEQAERRGINGMRDHRASCLTRGDLEWADLIVIMDNGNWKRLQAALGEISGEWRQPKVTRLGWAGGEVMDRIKDPAFMKRGSDELSEVADVIVRQTKELAKDIVMGEVRHA